MIQLLAGLYGLGLETASVLAREMLCRSFKDRRALAAFAGLSGTPFNSGGSEREQGIGKNGDARVRVILMQFLSGALPHDALLERIERRATARRAT